MDGFGEIDQKKVLEPEMERCLVVIKPEHCGIAYDIIKYLEQCFGDDFKQDRIVAVGYKAYDSVSPEIARAHCAQHKGKWFEDILVGQYEGKEAFVVVYEGPRGLVDKMRKIIGDKDPAKARKQRFVTGDGKYVKTIRGKYSDPEETLQRSIDGGYGTRNVIHVSDSPFNAIWEIRAWNPHFENPFGLNIGESEDPVWRLMEFGDFVAGMFYDQNKTA